QISVEGIPYAAVSSGSAAFVPAGPERPTVRLELGRGGIVEITSGIQGFRLLRLGGSAVHGFVCDEDTTLPDIKNRPLHMWLDLEWQYTKPEASFCAGIIPKAVRLIVHDVFESFDSGSIQQIIYQTGGKILEQIPDIAEIHLEANNRTWDTITE